MEAIISCRNICKRFAGVRALDGVNLDLYPGEIHALIGENGAGKSTTLKMLLGLVHPTNGEITVFGRAMNAKNRLEILRNTGSLIESPSCYGHLTGAENLRILQMLRRVPERAIEEALALVRLKRSKAFAHTA